jgi:hypothetical protein
MNELVVVIAAIVVVVIVLNEIAMVSAGFLLGCRWRNEIARKRADQAAKEATAEVYHWGYWAGYDKGYRRM